MSFKKRGFIRKQFVEEQESSGPDYNEMKAHFLKRTNRHIQMVGEYLDKAIEAYPEYEEDLSLRKEKHDETKFAPPEFKPYIHLTWEYKCKDDGVDYKMDEDMKHMCHDATFHHIKNNKHHPEYWDNSLDTNPVSFENRDKPSGILVKAERMDKVSILEMVCDWCAMGQERGTCPIEWAKNNLGNRWRFDQDQEKFIYAALNRLLGKDIEESIEWIIDETFPERFLMICEESLEDGLVKLRRMFHTANPNEKRIIQKSIDALEKKISQQENPKANQSEKIIDGVHYMLNYGVDQKYQPKRVLSVTDSITPDDWYEVSKGINTFLYDSKKKTLYADKASVSHRKLILQLIEIGVFPQKWSKNLEHGVEGFDLAHPEMISGRSGVFEYENNRGKTLYGIALWNKDVPLSTLQELLVKLKEKTKFRFDYVFLPDRTFSAIHEEMMDESIHDKYKFKAFFTAGGPGNGKSFIAKLLFNPDKITIISSDTILEYILKKTGLSKKLDPQQKETFEKQMALRNVAKSKSVLQIENLINGMLPLVIDGTGKSYDRIKTQKDWLEKHGYDTHMVLVNTNKETAVRRNEKRERSIAKDAVLKMWSQVQDNIGKFQELFGDKFLIIDNSTQLDKQQMQEKQNNLLRKVRHMLSAPIENHLGKEAIQSLEKSGGNTLKDLKEN